jgi:hypothetical protein
MFVRQKHTGGRHSEGACGIPNMEPRVYSIGGADIRS